MSEDGNPVEQRVVPNIDTLPLDIQRKIIGPLTLKDRCNVRRVNKAMEEAVALTDWRCVGRAHLEVALSFICRIIFEHVLTDEAEINLGWRRLFASMRGTLLDIDRIPSDDPRFRAVNDFIDLCRFDCVTITFAPGQPLERYRELIDCTKQVTLDHSYFTKEEYLFLTRPVTFACDRFLEDGASCHNSSSHNDELFLTLLRRGHSFGSTKVNLQSAKNIIAAIHLVMKSPVNQVLDISTPLNIAEEFVRLAFDDLVAQRSAMDVPGSRTRLYRYLRRANVGLYEVRRPTAVNYARGKFYVASSNKADRCGVVNEEEENNSDDDGDEGEYYDVSD